MAAVEGLDDFALVDLQGESLVELQGESPDRDTIGGLQSRYEREAWAFRIRVEETEVGRVAAVVEAEAAEEAEVGDEVEPSLADGGGCGGRGRRISESRLSSYSGGAAGQRRLAVISSWSLYVQIVTVEVNERMNRTVFSLIINRYLYMGSRLFGMSVYKVKGVC